MYSATPSWLREKGTEGALPTELKLSSLEDAEAVRVNCIFAKQTSLSSRWINQDETPRKCGQMPLLW